MLDAPHLRGIGEHRPLAVHDHGILVPARPQLAAHLHVLVGAVVARVRIRPVGPEVGVQVAVERGDDVPGGASAGQVVDGRPQARRIEGMAVAGREGGAEADVLRHRAHVRQQRDRIVLRRLHGVAQRRLHRAAVGVGDVVEVGEEHHVEPAPLAQPGDVLIELRAVPAIGGVVGARVPPHGEAVIGRPVHQELGQMDLALAVALHELNGRATAYPRNTVSGGNPSMTRPMVM